MKKILFVAGARPNFMKIAPVLRELEHSHGNSVVPILVHTGQHYDEAMSGVFFKSLGIRQPEYNLGVGSESHANQTSKIMVGFEDVCLKVKPDMVVVFGDVNSTIAAALVAKKMCIPLCHVEAGLRSGDRTMPEEINRLATDSITDLFFVTEESGLSNLMREGQNPDHVHFVGHVMIDNLFYQLAKLNDAQMPSELIALKTKKSPDYACMTLHRPSNVDSMPVLQNIVIALEKISKQIPIIFPCHPRTQKNLKRFGLFERLSSCVSILDPLGYNEFLYLWKDAKFVLTDSGGLQEESTALRIPCLTLRDNTERPITAKIGSNTLVGHDYEKLLFCVEQILNKTYKRGEIPRLWDGRASVRICEIITRYVR